MRTYTQISFKGGVGKTATTVNLADAAARAGYRTLLVDFEPQASTTQYIARDLEWEKGITRALHHPDEAVKSIHLMGENLCIMPSSESLLGLKVDVIMRRLENRDLDARLQKQEALRDLLGRPIITENFDLCFVDTSPSIGIFTMNAINVGTIISPITVESPSMKGLFRLRQALSKFPGSPPPTYIAPVQYNAGYRQSKDVLRWLKDHFEPVDEGGMVLPKIRQSQDVPHSYQAGKPVHAYKSSSRAAEDYQRLFETLQRLDGGTGRSGGAPPSEQPDEAPQQAQGEPEATA